MLKLVPHFGPQQAIQGVKSIDNWFGAENHKGKTWKDFEQEVRNFFPNSNKDYRTSPLRFDPKFVEICRDVGYSPKYQYQLLS